MSPNEIIQRVRLINNADNARLLWHLQSLSLEEGGAERFVKGVQQFLSTEAIKKLSRDWELDSLPGILRQFDCQFWRFKELNRPHELVEYMRLSEQAATDDFYRTNIGRTVWDT